MFSDGDGGAPAAGVGSQGGGTWMNVAVMSDHLCAGCEGRCCLEGLVLVDARFRREVHGADAGVEAERPPPTRA